MDNAMYFVPVFLLIIIEERDVDKDVSELKGGDSNYHTPNSIIEVLNFTLIQLGHALECADGISDWRRTVS